MDDNRKTISEGRGVGVGYVTLIMLFAVICLTVLASLSYQAARANDKLSEKSISFTNSFYSADSRAKETLAQLDGWAAAAHETGFFDDSFPLMCEENENLTVKRTQEGYEISYSEPVSDNLELSAVIVFFGAPTNGQRYRTDSWKTVPVIAENEGDTLGVWDGSIPR